MTVYTHPFSRKSGFRYEADMVPLIRYALPRLAFRREPVSPVKVFTEVPAVQGVPDVAGVRFIESNLQVRTDAGIRPLSTDIEIRTILALDHQTLSVDELSHRVGTSRQYMRSAVLPLLDDLGWLHRNNGAVHRRPEAVWVARRVVTVEAKLRNWQGALSQARRQQYSADASYIALDAANLGPVLPYLDEIARGGIGVLAVNRDNESCRVLVRPCQRKTIGTEVGKLLLAERCLEMMQRGTFEGQIHPVFGHYPPSS